MSTLSPDARAARRAAIDDRLRRRLAGDFGPAPAPPAAQVAFVLECLACGATSSVDARFCTRCGVKFNVRALPGTEPGTPRGPRS